MSCTPSVTVPHTTHVLDASKGPQDTVELTGSRSASSYLHKMPEDWDAEEVADWVTDKGFKSWASLFIGNMLHFLNSDKN